MDIDYETARLLQEEFQQEFTSSSKASLSDSFFARQLQSQFEMENSSRKSQKSENMSDSFLAKSLQEQFQQEEAVERLPVGDLVYDKKIRKNSTKSLVDPSWEVIDPTPDVHILFVAFNNKFFWGKLDSVCVSWSKKMKLCAGVCSYQGRGGMCHITLSEPLLKLRPRKDLVETLLHEMIHALLFVTDNNRDRDGHGPEFHKHMYRINAEAGTNITVYHDFHDEVELYRQHWWRCDGPCIKWKPFFGIVRRSVNRAPAPTDRWWGEHSRNCGGTFHKINSPEPKVKDTKKGKENKPVNLITKYISTQKSSNNNTTKEAKSPTLSVNVSVTHPTNRSKSWSATPQIHTISAPNSGLSTNVTIQSKVNNIHGFSNFGSKNCAGATKNASNTIVINKKRPSSTVTSETKPIVPFKTNTINNTTLIKKEDNKGSNIDIDFVRNHWTNRYNNTQPSTSSSNNSVMKRKSQTNPPVIITKAPKLIDTLSQDSLDGGSVECPVCNTSYPIETLNSHLDLCLANEIDEPKKECVICAKKISENIYEDHVDICVGENFDDDVFVDKSQKSTSEILFEEDTMDVINSVKCHVCENEVPIDSLNEHLKICKNRTKCPECGDIVKSDYFDTHLAECLIKQLDNFNQLVGNPREEPSDNEKEMVECLVCGKKVLKSYLNSHLDECLCKVFDNEKEFERIVVEDEDDGLFNCPFCMKLISEAQMNQHIDVCLKIVDEDKEAELNKSVFLKEME